MYAETIGDNRKVRFTAAVVQENNDAIGIGPARYAKAAGHLVCLARPPVRPRRARWCVLGAGRRRTLVKFNRESASEGWPSTGLVIWFCSFCSVLAHPARC